MSATLAVVSGVVAPDHWEENTSIRDQLKEVFRYLDPERLGTLSELFAGTLHRRAIDFKGQLEFDEAIVAAVEGAGLL